jgi:hypothetical protein
MTTNYFILGAVVAVIFFLVKFLEMRLMADELKPLKTLIREMLIVYVSTVAGVMILNQFNVVSALGGEAVNAKVAPPAFVDNPGF